MSTWGALLCGGLFAAALLAYFCRGPNEGRRLFWLLTLEAAAMLLLLIGGDVAPLALALIVVAPLPWLLLSPTEQTPQAPSAPPTEHEDAP